MASKPKPVYSKRPLTPLQQVRFLEEKGLVVTDPDAAEAVLRRVGFYRFKGYALTLRDLETADKRFHNGVCFEDVMRLMDLDDSLRLIVLRGIQVLEPAVRAVINEVLCHRHGIRWYANASLFKQRPIKRGASKRPTFDHAQFLSKCREEFYRSREELFVKHYRTKYDEQTDPPAWMLSETLTMGVWSLVFQHLSDENSQKEIAARFGMHVRRMSSWLHSMSTLRNSCAHHARIWNREFGVRPGLRDVARDYQGESPLTGNDRLGAQLMVLHQFLRVAAPEIAWVRELWRNLKGCSDWELNLMGLKPTWSSSSLFAP